MSDPSLARGASPAVALRAEAVTKRFGETVALDGVTLEVRRGECVALIGESGSGKTTLLRCFNRLTTPDGGRVLVEGSDAATLDPFELRRRTGYVPQDGGLLPHWSVRRNVALVPWLRGGGTARDAAARSLRLVGLDPERFGSRWPRELSGGQRQRVAVARALVSRPRLIVADEPTGMLDAELRAGVVELLDELRTGRGLAVLHITHDLALARASCTRVVVMCSGQVVEEGPAGEVFAAPQHPYTAALVAAATWARPTTNRRTDPCPASPN